MSVAKVTDIKVSSPLKHPSQNELNTKVYKLIKKLEKDGDSNEHIQ